MQNFSSDYRGNSLAMPAGRGAAGRGAAAQAIQAAPTVWRGLTKKEWGPRAWRWLHTMAINYPQEPGPADAAAARARIANFVQTLPCAECRAHSIEYVRATPPDLTGSQALQVWAWRFHNEVNRRLGRRPFPFAAYSQLYLSERCWANLTAAECGR